MLKGQSFQQKTRSLTQKGASMIEYAVVVLLIVLIAVIAVASVGEAMRDQFAEATQGVSGQAVFPEPTAIPNE